MTTNQNEITFPNFFYHKSTYHKNQDNALVQPINQFFSTSKIYLTKNDLLKSVHSHTCYNVAFYVDFLHHFFGLPLKLFRHSRNAHKLIMFVKSMIFIYIVR